MMQSPYDIGFGSWFLWLGISVVKLLILGILSWSVVSILRHRERRRSQTPETPSPLLDGSSRRVADDDAPTERPRPEHLASRATKHSTRPAKARWKLARGAPS